MNMPRILVILRLACHGALRVSVDPETPPGRCGDRNATPCVAGDDDEGQAAATGAGLLARGDPCRRSRLARHPSRPRCRAGVRSVPAHGPAPARRDPAAVPGGGQGSGLVRLRTLTILQGPVPRPGDPLPRAAIRRRLMRRHTFIRLGLACGCSGRDSRRSTPCSLQGKLVSVRFSCSQAWSIVSSSLSLRR